MANVIEGLKELREKLGKVPQKLVAEIDTEIGLGTIAMANTAKRLAPAGKGNILRTETTAEKIKDLVWEFVSQAGYAGYVEFGTRSKVRIPAGAEQLAAEVRNNKFKSSLSAKEAIYSWCKFRGIDPKLWYPIYRSIMVNGIEPHPFFFPAFSQELPKIISNVKRVLNRILE